MMGANIFQVFSTSNYLRVGYIKILYYYRLCKPYLCAKCVLYRRYNKTIEYIYSYFEDRIY